MCFYEPARGTIETVEAATLPRVLEWRLSALHRHHRDSIKKRLRRGAERRETQRCERAVRHRAERKASPLAQGYSHCP